MSISNFQQMFAPLNRPSQSHQTPTVGLGSMGITLKKLFNGTAKDTLEMTVPHPCKNALLDPGEKKHYDRLKLTITRYSARYQTSDGEKAYTLHEAAEEIKEAWKKQGPLVKVSITIDPEEQNKGYGRLTCFVPAAASGIKGAWYTDLSTSNTRLNRAEGYRECPISAYLADPGKVEGLDKEGLTSRTKHEQTELTADRKKKERLLLIAKSLGKQGKPIPRPRKKNGKGETRKGSLLDQPSDNTIQEKQPSFVATETITHGHTQPAGLIITPTASATTPSSPDARAKLAKPTHLTEDDKKTLINFIEICFALPDDTKFSLTSLAKINGDLKNFLLTELEEISFLLKEMKSAFQNAKYQQFLAAVANHTGRARKEENEINALIDEVDKINGENNKIQLVKNVQMAELLLMEKILKARIANGEQPLLNELLKLVHWCINAKLNNSKPEVSTKTERERFREETQRYRDTCYSVGTDNALKTLPEETLSYLRNCYWELAYNENPKILTEEEIQKNNSCPLPDARDLNQKEYEEITSYLNRINSTTKKSVYTPENFENWRPPTIPIDFGDNLQSGQQLTKIERKSNDDDDGGELTADRATTQNTAATKKKSAVEKIKQGIEEQRHIEIIKIFSEHSISATNGNIRAAMLLQNVAYPIDSAHITLITQMGGAEKLKGLTRQQQHTMLCLFQDYINNNQQLSTQELRQVGALLQGLVTTEADAVSTKDLADALDIQREIDEYIKAAKKQAPVNESLDTRLFRHKFEGVWLKDITSEMLAFIFQQYHAGATQEELFKILAHNDYEADAADVVPATTAMTTPLHVPPVTDTTITNKTLLTAESRQQLEKTAILVRTPAKNNTLLGNIDRKAEGLVEEKRALEQRLHEIEEAGKLAQTEATNKQKQLEEQIDKLNQQIANDSRQTGELQKELTATYQELNALRQQQQFDSAAHKNAIAMVQQLQQEKTNQAENLEKTRGAVETLQEAVHNTASLQQQTQNNLDTANLERQALENQKIQQAQELQRLKDELLHQQKKAAQTEEGLTKQIETIKAQGEENQSHADSQLNALNEELKELKTAYQSELATQKQKIEDAQKRLEDAEEKLRKAQSTQDALEKQRKTLQDQVGHLNQQLAEAQTAIEQSNTENLKAEQTIAQQQAELMKIQSQANDLKHSLDQTHEENRQIQAQLGENETARNELDANMRKLKHELASIEQAHKQEIRDSTEVLRNLQEEIDSLNQCITNGQQSNNTLLEQLNEKNKEIAHVKEAEQSALEQYKIDINAVTEKLKDTTEALQNLTSEKNELLVELEKLTRQVQELEEQLTQASATIAKQDATIAQSKIDQNGLAKQVSALKSEIEQAHDLFNQQQKTLEAITEEKERIEAEKEEATQELKDATNEHEEKTKLTNLQIAALTSQAAENTTTIDTLKIQITEMTASDSDNKEKLTKLMKQLEIATQDHATITMKLNELKQKEEEDKLKIKKLEELLKQKNENINNINHEQKTLKDLIDQLAKTVEQLESALEEKRSNYEALQTKYSALEEQYCNAQKIISELENQANNENKNNEELNDSLNQARKNILKYEEQLAHTEAEKNRLDGDNKRLSTQLEKYQTALTTNQSNYDDIKTKLNNEEQEVTKLNNQIEEVDKKNKTLQNLLNDNTLQLEKFNEIKRKFEEKVASLESDDKTNKNTIEELKEALSAANNKNNNDEKKIKELQQDLEENKKTFNLTILEFKKQIDEKTNEYDKKNKEYIILKENNDGLQKEIKKLNETIEEFKKQVKELEQEQDKYQQLLLAKRDENAKLKQELENKNKAHTNNENTYRTRVEELTASNAELQSRIVLVQRLLDQLTNQREIDEKQIENLNKEIRNLERLKDLQEKWEDPSALLNHLGDILEAFFRELKQHTLASAAKINALPFNKATIAQPGEIDKLQVLLTEIKTHLKRFDEFGGLGAGAIKTIGDNSTGGEESDKTSFSRKNPNKIANLTFHQTTHKQHDITPDIQHRKNAISSLANIFHHVVSVDKGALLHFNPDSNIFYISYTQPNILTKTQSYQYCALDSSGNSTLKNLPPHFLKSKISQKKGHADNAQAAMEFLRKEIKTLNLPSSKQLQTSSLFSESNITILENHYKELGGDPTAFRRW